MYLQTIWDSEHGGTTLEVAVDGWADLDQETRDEPGPPADYDPATFGEDNVYYIPALMWDQLRKRIGDDLFWELVRRWPEDHDNDNASYDQITTWWSERTGRGPRSRSSTSGCSARRRRTWPEGRAPSLANEVELDRVGDRLQLVHQRARQPG